MVSIDKDQGKKKVTEVKTFSVPFALEEIKENITINTNAPSKLSKEQIKELAINFHLKGNILEAAKYYEYFINQGFSDPNVFSNYGAIFRNLGKLKDAEILYRKAIKINPNFAEAYSNLGSVLSELGELQEAEYLLRKAIELNPDLADANYNIGTILIDLGKSKEAELFLRKAIEVNPDFADAHVNLGNILKDLGKLQEAELSQRKAIELNPDYAEAHSNLGNVLLDLGKIKEAELSQRKAIELNPNYADAYWNLALLQLLQGDYKNGLENYEFRLKKKKHPIPLGNTKLKRIEHKKLHTGKKLLVVSEQGLGDTFQYMRYIPYLRSQGLNVLFSAQEKLHSLIKASGIDLNPLTPNQANTISEGEWISLLSLPRYLQINPKNPIITQRYIYSTDELNQKWKNIFSQEKRPIIGINWQGNPKMEKQYYQGRSIPLSDFSLISEKNDITMLSLQKGFGSEQLNHCSFKNKFVKCQPQIDATWDFLENAAIIENCDLIITCDTSIAHLAGGLGKKVWLLLKDIPFWTWGLKEESTFWYPSMRLFRQKERQNWQEVIERVSIKLKKEIEVKI